MLGLHWYDPEECSPAYYSKWKTWSIVAAIRLFLYLCSIFYLYLNRAYLEARPDRLASALNTRNLIDLGGAIWFIVGIVWVFDYNGRCLLPFLPFSRLRLCAYLT